MKKRGQVSVEALIVIAMLLVVLISILTFRTEVMSGITNEYHSAKVKALADKITQTGTFVYSQGSGAKMVIFVTVPDVLEDITLSGKIMVINMNISGKKETTYRKTDYFMNGTVPEGSGNYCLLFRSYPGYVEVSNFNGSC